jgi:hypothetical protein
LVEHHIETGDAKPLKQPPRRVPMAYAEDEKKLIDTMQRQGIIQKSSSPWSSPLVLVMKKNGKIRPCVDYRRLNSVTKKDAFPFFENVSENFCKSSAMIMVSSGERSWTASLNKFSKCCGTIPLFPPTHFRRMTQILVRLIW